VRQSVHRLERSGYTAAAIRPSAIGAALRHDLEALARDWRGAQPERGFVMALDTLFRLDDEHALFVIGRASDGSVAGFLHFSLCRGWESQRLRRRPISPSAGESARDLAPGRRSRARTGLGPRAQLELFRAAWCRSVVTAADFAPALAFARCAVRQPPLAHRLLDRDRRMDPVRRGADAGAALARPGLR